MEFENGKRYELLCNKQQLPHFFVLDGVDNFVTYDGEVILSDGDNYIIAARQDDAKYYREVVWTK